LIDEIESIGFHSSVAIGFVMMLLANKVDELLFFKVDKCESFTDLCLLICDSSIFLLLEVEEQDEKGSLMLIDRFLSLITEPTEESLLISGNIKEALSDDDLAKRCIATRAHYFFEDLYDTVFDDTDFLTWLSEKKPHFRINARNFIFGYMLASNNDKVILLVVIMIIKFGHYGDDDYILTKLTDLAVKGNYHAWQAINNIRQEDSEQYFTTDDRILGALVASGLKHSLNLVKRTK
jgi:acyl-CoA-binding protein